MLDANFAYYLDYTGNSRTRGVWDLKRSPTPYEPGLIAPFFDFLKAEVFLHEIYMLRQKYCALGDPAGSPTFFSESPSEKLQLRAVQKQ